MDESVEPEGEPMAVEVAGGRRRPKSRTPRQCVQTKLIFGRSRAEDQEEEDGRQCCESEDEINDNGKRKRKGRAQAKTLRKAPVIGNNAGGLVNGSKSLLATAESDFFVKVSEKRRRQKKQKEQEEETAVITGNIECCKDSMSSDEIHPQPIKCGLNATILNDPASTPFKRTCSKRKLTYSKLDTAKDYNTQTLHANPPVIDLTLETKPAAEESKQLSAGRQVHPFFSFHKATKRTSEKLEKTRFGSIVDDVLLFPPVHVFEKQEDVVDSLNWEKWLFSKKNLLNANVYGGPEGTSLPLFEGSVEPLKFDSGDTVSRIHGPVLPCKEGFCNQSPNQRVSLSIQSKTASTAWTDEQDTHEQLLSYLSRVLKTEMVPVKSNHKAFSRCPTVDNLEEIRNRILQKRCTSYQLHNEDCPDSSLWTYKYEPVKAIEVCGNSGPVKIISDWLSSWQERASQISKSSLSHDKCTVHDSDGSWSEDHTDTESEEGTSLKNVLLVTGPVGCGKSAAIYACAKEHGFEVIEVNASGARNGAHIKHTFGELLGSHTLNKWSPGKKLTPHAKKATKESPDSYGNGLDKKNSASSIPNKSLVLFEDVDTIFDEDRGFLKTVLQLAETAKRPIILTSNTKDPVLPHLMDRLIVDFERPPSTELLSYVYMICAAEKVCISPLLLDLFIRSCHGDIRRTILLLQYWCQGKGDLIVYKEIINQRFVFGSNRTCYLSSSFCLTTNEGRMLTCSDNPLQFDLDAAHMVIPRIIPWGFPCELSKLVLDEISKALSVAKESLWITDDVKEEERTLKEMIDPFYTIKNERHADTGESDSMVERKSSVIKCTDFSALLMEDDVSDATGSPVKYARRTRKYKSNTVLSSQSGDELSIDDLPVADVMSRHPICNPSLDVPMLPLAQPIDASNYLDPFFDHIYQSERSESFKRLFKFSERSSSSHVCDTYISRVPESCIAAETMTDNQTCYLSSLLPVDHLSALGDDASMSSGKPIHVQSELEASNVDKALTVSKKYSVLHCEVDAESIQGNEEFWGSQNDGVEDLSRGYQLMDECSRADFSMGFVPVENLKRPLVADLVQDTWRKLRSRREDTKLYISAIQRDVSQLVKLASGLTDLMSEIDILLSGCNPFLNDLLETSMVPCFEPDVFTWYDEQVKIASTAAEHGLCLYADKCAAVGSKMGCEKPVPLAQEMLASSSSTMALGKLLSEATTESQDSSIERHLQEILRCSISLRREELTTLYKRILPIVPAKMHLALKGPAFYEYLSFLSHITKSENVRVSDSINGAQWQRRTRVSQHYLKSHPLALSPEDVTLLSQYSCYGEVEHR